MAQINCERQLKQKLIWELRFKLLNQKYFDQKVLNTSLYFIVKQYDSDRIIEYCTDYKYTA